MEKEVTFCEYCGAEIPKKSAFCDKCGKATKLAAQETKATPVKSNKKTSRGKFPFIIAGAIIAVIGIALAVYFLTEDSTGNTIIFESIESEDLSAAMKFNTKSKAEKPREKEGSSGKPRSKGEPDTQLSEGALKLLAAKDAKPSFDCAKASTPPEKAICSDVGLAELDNRLAGAYSKASSTCKKGQKEWLTDRDYCLSNISCLKNSYKTRIDELENCR